MKRSTLTAAVLAATSLALPAFAQGEMVGHPYIGAAGGASHVNGGCAAGVSCDNNDTAWKIYGGWTFPGDFATELTYYDLGKFTAGRPGEYRLERHGEMLRCPWHGWEFDIKTGQSWCHPESVKARTYAVEVVPGEALAKGPFVAETVPVAVEQNYVVVEL